MWCVADAAAVHTSDDVDDFPGMHQPLRPDGSSDFGNRPCGGNVEFENNQVRHHSKELPSNDQDAHTAAGLAAGDP